MRTSFIALAALALSAAASPALAQDAPTSDVTINGGATVVTDYRFRGISQSDKRFAVQGTFTVSSASTGLYGTVWGSSIDDYVTNGGGGGDTELDLIVGWKKTFGAATVDLGVLYYYYPNSGGFNTDFFEPYGSVSGAIGPATVKVSAAYAPKSRAIGFRDQNLDGRLDKEDNLYVAGDLSFAIPDTGVSLTGHLGHSFGPSYLTIGDEYTDWGAGASYTWRNFTFGVSYVDTDGDFITPSGRNASKAGVVGSVGVSF